MDRRLRVAVMLSGGASGLKYLMDKDENFNKKYMIVEKITDNKNASGIEKYQRVTVFDYKEWCAENHCDYKNMQTRSMYFSRIADYLSNFNVDLIILSGFMLKITDNFIDLFERRIINIHPADLSIIGENNKPKYRGDKAVKKAIESGEQKTFSTIHFASKELDCGEIICISEGLPIGNRTPEEQQELMKTKCDGPALKMALDKIINSEIILGALGTQK